MKLIRPRGLYRFMPKGKCDVCGVKGEVFVGASACGATSFAYCKDCLSAWAEPWNALVTYVSIGGHYPDDINEMYRGIVKNTCERLGKTEEEFAKAVDEAIERDSYTDFRRNPELSEDMDWLEEDF